ncbi:hypothetical protein GY45DRAFT_1328411 [Cubamyces sp. BRFM 1775]|nr:hypothetical protein GY45DRAFT_1328411 [Cubamyces sp. BRFM 1775]
MVSPKAARSAFNVQGPPHPSRICHLAQAVSAQTIFGYHRVREGGIHVYVSPIGQTQGHLPMIALSDLGHFARDIFYPSQDVFGPGSRDCLRLSWLAGRDAAQGEQRALHRVHLPSSTRVSCSLDKQAR